MSDNGILDRLATLAGIEPDYYDIWGTQHAPSADVKRELLRAMGFAVETETETAQSLSLLDEMPWRRTLEPVSVVTLGDRVAVPIRLLADRAKHTIGWRLAMEDGTTISGSVMPNDLPLIETRCLDDRSVELRTLSVLAPLVPGYHQFEVDGHALSDMSTRQSTLIVAPRQAFLPENLSERTGTWGFAVQVYALQGCDSWGIGDFGDLARFARASATMGAGILGINPLHALFPGNPAQASPYSPSSRRFLNTLYTDVTSVLEYKDCPDLHAMSAGSLSALREMRLVDYPGVAAIKLQAFERLYQSFCSNHRAQGDARARAFEAFRRAGGMDLERFAIFSALDEHFWKEVSRQRSWREWPEAYRDPASQAVIAFAQGHHDRIQFHQYLQWEADRQLGATAAACRVGGMAVGLYRDLAVGVDPEGADVWADRQFFAEGISTGAPPDSFNLKGQSWGLPPFKPLELRNAAYRPFIAALRANMQHAGALRIDHVMGLMRLFWVPSSGDATMGGYVRYPLDELIAVTALESHRAQCIVVGEDLGTVPEGLRDRLGSANILSTRLLYFERDGSQLRRASSYPKLSQVSIRTQDLPTFSGFWRECDIALMAALNLIPSPDNETEMRRERSELKEGILALLRREGLGDDVEAIEADPAALAAALYRFLASSPARVVMVYLEDLLGLDVQTNVPGTVCEYPNWRHKLSGDWQRIMEQPQIRLLAEILIAARPPQLPTIAHNESGPPIAR